MKYRCTNPRALLWPDYGARGISFCARWSKYEAFLADMGRKPSRLYSLDRIDNNGHYGPGNCKWSTAKEQANNRRSARATSPRRRHVERMCEVTS